MPKAKPKANTNHSITATAACRADLAGSTLDLWPLYLFHPGAVTVNFAVNILTRCTIMEPQAEGAIEFHSLDTGREDRFAGFDEFCSAKKVNHALAGALLRYFTSSGAECREGFRIETHSESPAGAGISGSSALMVATTAAMARMFGRELAREEIRVIAQNVEAQLIRVPTGCQDYYPALFGGVSAVHLDPDGIHREEIHVAPEQIESRFVLVYTGAPRQSGINNWEVFKSHINGDKRVFRNFEQISQIAQQMHQAVADADWDDVSRLLHEEWSLRKTNAPGISTPLMEKLIKVARKNGALAAKVCGAGGGGCFILFAEPEAHDRVIKAVNGSGGQVLPYKVAAEGVAVSGGL